MATDTITVNPNTTVAVQVVAAGDGPTLVINTSLTLTVYLGDTDGIRATDASGIMPLGPNGSVTVNGQNDLFVVNGNSTPVTIATLTGGTSTFLGLTEGMGNLAIPSVQSPNFVTNVSGWQVDQNGNAQFNNLTLRGTFFGTDFIINSAGMFLYSGTPALGNLVESHSPIAGVDQFGNAYKAQTEVFGSGSSFVNIATANGFKGFPAVTLNAPNMAHVTDFIQIASDNVNPGAVNEQSKMVLSSGKENHLDDAAIQLFSESNDGTVGAAAIVEFGGTILVTINRSEFLIQEPLINNSVSTAPSLVTTDTFHAITLDANWTTLVGQPIPSVQLCADGMVHITGAIQFNANINNTNINGGTPLAAALGNFPGYRPATEIFIAGAPGSAGISIGTNGVVVAAQSPGQTTTFCNFNGRYPINL